MAALLKPPVIFLFGLIMLIGYLPPADARDPHPYWLVVREHLNKYARAPGKNSSPIPNYEELRNKGAHGLVMVRFALNREGMIEWSEVILSSCVAFIDEDALALIRGAQPFPPFLSSIKGSRIIIRYPIEYLPRGGKKAVQPARDHRGECLTS